MLKLLAPIALLAALPAAAGLGFKPEHFPAIRDTRPALGFFEVHAENYMGAGGPPHAMLAALRADYGLSLHGVGLSIGGLFPMSLILSLDHLDEARRIALLRKPDPPQGQDRPAKPQGQQEPEVNQ